MEPTLCPPSDAGPTPPAGVLNGRSGVRYTVGPAPIGAGAQAEVWPAVRDDGLSVAIKFARPARSAIEALDSEGRFLEALSRAGSGCTVPCIDRVEWEGRPGLVLPRLPSDVGDLVRAQIAAEPGRALEAVLQVGVQLARALAALHVAELASPGSGSGDARLVHRDVKPENVLVDATGAVRLADLGGSLLADGRATVELGVFGSPLWAPPDQMLPGMAEPNPTWDTYAACVMVYAWIAGLRPTFQADPAPRLLPRGREILDRMNEMAVAGPAERIPAIEALFRVRDGARVEDVIDRRAPTRFSTPDREALAAGIVALADAAVYGDDALQGALFELIAVFERGLAPHVAPSPPNRFWRADELAEELEGVARRLAVARRNRANPPIALPLGIERTVVERAGTGVFERHVMLPDFGSLIETAPLWQSREARPVVSAQPPVPTEHKGARGWWLPLAVVVAVFAVWPALPPPSSVANPGAQTALVPAGALAPGWRGGSTGAAVGSVVPAFRIARTEVSNRAYAACVAAGACEPLAWAAPGSPWELGVGTRGSAFRLLVGDRQPAVGVTWDQASTWCGWAGGRLPTEAQWERAAFGDEEPRPRSWPWGETPPDCTRANLGACGLGLTVAVDSLTPGASAWGAVHMAGNAWEWTDTAARGGGARVLRGGAFDTSESPRGGQRAPARTQDRPSRVSPTYSFRCVFPE
ncbi:MAG: SUMF1/EgtB/PvdO family nonheme iron enzyme [Pseudomonadota bacterium]|nr:SUMF1/EgtB/PvdO family nonheme iron enzyme [Pseudomonadota bacterium]